MHYQFVKDTTNATIYVWLKDSSDGEGFTGLTFDTAGLACYYVRPLAVAVQIPLVARTVAQAHSDGGFVEVSAANMPGLYRLDLPDAVVADGADDVSVSLSGVVNMEEKAFHITLARSIEDQVCDAILTGATHNIPTSLGRRLREIQSGAYSGGSVWINTISGTPGTTDFENGTVSNPVDNIADAATIAASVGLRSFRIGNASSITLGQTFNGFAFLGRKWTLALGGQDITNSYFSGAEITGIAIGSGPEFDHCEMGTCTIPPCIIHRTSFSGTITLSGAGSYFFHNSFEAETGGVAPVFDFGAAVANTNLGLRAYNGSVELQNLNAAGVDIVSIEGAGHLTLNANCVGGTVDIHGAWEFIDNAGGAVTVNQDARFSVTNRMLTNADQIDGGSATPLKDSMGVMVLITVSTANAAATATRFRAIGTTRPLIRHFNSRKIYWITGALADSTTDITAYEFNAGDAEGDFTVALMPAVPANGDTGRLM